MGDAVGLATGLIEAVGLGGGGFSSSDFRGVGFGVGASPKFALRLPFAPTFPITVAGVDCSREFVLALPLVFEFAFASVVITGGVDDKIGWG